MTARHHHLFRTLVALAAIASGFVSAAAWIINRPETLRHALAVANLKSSWHVGIEKFTWRPLEGTFEIHGITAANEKRGKRLAAEELSLSYRLLGLLRGKLVIDRLAIRGVDLSLPPAPGPKEKRAHRRLNLARLLLLRNLEIEDARVEGLSIAFGKEMAFALDALEFSLRPTLFGDTRLSLLAEGSRLSKGERGIVRAGSLTLAASTDLARWDDDFPYLNGIDGSVHAADILLEGIAADSLGASVEMDDASVRLTSLECSVGGRALTGTLTADRTEQLFDLAVDIPKPIALPFIGRPTETIDTAGELSGKIRIEGRGFIPSETEGKGRMELTHRFDAAAEAPVSVAADLSWREGAIAISDAAIRAGSDALSASGTIDARRKRFAFKAKGANFPIEHIFTIFRNPHMRKIFGASDVEGSIEGWGKTFTARVQGTTRGGGWRPITAGRIETELEATYDLLKLKGTIFSGDRQTGEADLTIRYGPKVGSAPRSKQIDLEAKIDGHPLEESLASMGLAGTGDGRIRLVGPHTAFRGEADARISHGSWHGLPLERVASKLSITRRQILFGDLSLKFPRIDAAPISGNVVGDIGDGSIRLHGTPMAGLSLDATYQGPTSRWTIRGISWADPARPGNRLAASGSLASGGAMDVRIGGAIDLSALAFLTPFMREGSGPVDLTLAMRGSSADPGLFGTLAFHDNTFSPRGARLTLEHVDGALRFEGDRVLFDGVRARIEDGELAASGSFVRRGFSPVSADLTLTGRSMLYRSDDSTLRLELDGTVALSGPLSSPLLSGDVTILDGRYTKDFTLADAMGGKEGRARKGKEALSEFDPRLGLRVRNTGDLAIRNNVGDIWLNMNVDIRGTRRRPSVSGSIQAVEGKILYLGMDFDITKGFIELAEKYAAPFLEVHGQKEVGVYNVTAVLHGPTDNLALDLSATSPAGPLEKRDVVSLILFGITDQERASLRQAGGQITTSLAAGAVSGIVGRPVQKITGLDVFRLEAATGTTNVSRLSMGKRITDRLTVNLATDINTSDAVQTVIGEYQITDNLLLTGERATDSSSRITGSLRFRLR